MKPCSNIGCKRPIPDEALHCPYCGQVQTKKKSFPNALIYVIGVLFFATGTVIFRGVLTPGSLPTIQASSSPVSETESITNTFIVNTSTPDLAIQIFISPSVTPNLAEPTRKPNQSEFSFSKIVYTCQVFKDNNRNQVCIMNADGSNQRRLTQTDNANSWYASLSPDGTTIVFSSNQSGDHEIYEMDLNGNQNRLTSLGELYAPEISPNGEYIVFTNARGTYSSIWIMNRDGSDPHTVYSSSEYDAVDPTWSPDGAKILFALGNGDKKRLYTIFPNGDGLSILDNTFTTRGRTDWSPDGNKIAGYTGGPWERKVSIMNSDGSDLIELIKEGNVQAPSFSSDSDWLAFTGYIDAMGNDDGCEIYILRMADYQLKRLTDNNYCDWQPRWGP